MFSFCRRRRSFPDGCCQSSAPGVQRSVNSLTLKVTIIIGIIAIIIIILFILIIIIIFIIMAITIIITAVVEEDAVLNPTLRKSATFIAGVSKLGPGGRQLRPAG